MKTFFFLCIISLTLSITALASSNPINHLFLRLDKNTIGEITKNKFLQDEFSDFFAGESGDLNNKWTAVYIQGESTYLELFDENGSTTKADLGIALASNVQNWLMVSQLAKLADSCTQPYRCEIENRVKSQGDPVWFKQFKWLDGNDKLDTWIMEYDIGSLVLKKTPEGSIWNDNDITTKRYNSEWYRPDRLLKDIENVEITVTQDHFDRLILLSTYLEYKINLVSKDLAIISKEGQDRILVNLGSVTKVNKVTMSLNRWVPEKIISLGKSNLYLNALIAEWTFIELPQKSL